MRRKITKLFVDSRFATKGEGGSILYEIPDGGIELGPHAKVFLSEFTCVAAWATIDHTNDTQVLFEGEPGLQTQRTLVLPHGPHDIESLRAALEDALGAGYTVERTATGDTGSTSRQYRVSSTVGRFVLPRSPFSSITSFPNAIPASVQVSGFVDLRRCHNIFVHTPSFGAYNAIGPMGVRTAIAKIPVNVGYSGLVRWSTSGSEYDHVDCGVRSLHMLRLELRDSNNQLLDLAGTSFSLTLLFSDD